LSTTVLFAVSWFCVFCESCGVAVQPCSCRFVAPVKWYSELSAKRQNNAKHTSDSPNNHAGNHQQHEENKGRMSSVRRVAEGGVQNVRTKNQCTNPGRREDAHQHAGEKSCQRSDSCESLGEHSRRKSFRRTFISTDDRRQIRGWSCGCGVDRSFGGMSCSACWFHATATS
jgi:hypothetical protein